MRFVILAALAGTLLVACSSAPREDPAGTEAKSAPLSPPTPTMKRSQLQLLTDFSGFQSQINPATREEILRSPEIPPPNEWSSLVVSWNVELPPGGYLKIEARGIYPDHATKLYTLGLWSEDPARYPRESVVKQKDSDGDVHTDTLVLNRPGPKLQLRITLGGPSPKLKLIALSFLDSKTPALSLESNHAAWGKAVVVPERSQVTYEAEGGKGWCSPTSLSMVLASWADRLKRPELDLKVPVVARSVFDRNWPGTGNWPFNTAFAGAFPGFRAYVSRFDGITELEDWVAAGIPVIISAPYQLLGDQDSGSGNGHVVVCTGFTESGDVVVHDPWARLETGQKVRRVYQRNNVIKAWATSDNTVYLIYPESVTIPKNRHGHW